MEGVGLVASNFQFPLGLAAVFAEEVGGFFYFSFGWRFFLHAVNAIKVLVKISQVESTWQPHKQCY